MAADTSVKYMHVGMAGAPSFRGEAGSLISVLDACLVTGFDSRTADTLSVAGGVATLSRASGLAYEAERVVLVAGATPAALNGEKRVLAATATTITYDATGVADQTASGTITVKVAPLGWEKVFSGTNVAVYRPADPASSRLWLRVDDSADLSARIVGYEVMSDIDTGTGCFPTPAQMAGGLYWRKADYGVADRPWRLVGDSRLFYLMPRWSISYPANADMYVFGDVVTWKDGDAYPCAIVGYPSESSYPGGAYSAADCNNQKEGRYLARSFTQIGSAVRYGLYGAAASSASGYNGYPYPNPVNNGLLLNPTVLINEGEGYAAVRGTPPGLLQVLHAGAPLADGDEISDFVGAPAGTRMLMASSAYGSTTARWAINLTGPWRS